MKWTCAASVTTLVIAMTCSAAFAKKIQRQQVDVEAAPGADVPLPPDLVGKARGLQRTAAAADTFVLHWEDFDDGTLSPYIAVDASAQLGAFFHVADATELDGGVSGNLSVLSGARSMWCGVAPSSESPFCAWATLPGYGNDWVQMLQSSPQGGDSVVVSYKVWWDSEPGYDFTFVEWSHDGGLTWTSFPVSEPVPYRYTDTGPAPYATESFGDRVTGGNGTVTIRFRFTSDAAWSDEDGQYASDGAVIVDDITITTWSGSTLVGSDAEDFENAAVGSNNAGIWTATPAPVYGSYAALYPAGTLLQEDPCVRVTSIVVGFFADPSVANYACHTPDPRPDVGVIPYGTSDGVYMDNRIVSPVFSNAGYGNEYRLEFLVYRDLLFDNLVFYQWHVRSWVAGCARPWRNDNTLHGSPAGGSRDWVRPSFRFGAMVDPSASDLQISLSAIDFCEFFCGSFGSGACHSHAPLFDEVRVIRVGASTPQFTVSHRDGLFQDNFAQNGTLTGTSRADMAADLRADFPGIIVPGDTVSMTIQPLSTTGAGAGPNAYLYVSVWPQGQAAKSGAALGSSTVRKSPQPTTYGTRWPFVGTTSVSGITWSCFRMDTVFANNGGKLADRYCADLNDNLFTPGDTVCYFYAADADNTPNNGNEGYFTRSLNGQGADLVTTDIAVAASSRMEFTILPAGGYNNGGHILYVDNADAMESASLSGVSFVQLTADRNGPVQLFWDSSLEMLGLNRFVDRYDVLAPGFENSLASRVKNIQTQITNVYQTILWDSGDRRSGLVGDGTGSPEKSNDWSLLFSFLNTGQLGSGPGLYLAGDDLAEEWVTLSGAGAIQVRSAYMNFNLLNKSHAVFGETTSPQLTASGASFIHSGNPDEMVIYSGCPLFRDFDVLGPTGASITEYPYPVSGDGAVISKQATNVSSKTATVVLSGFSFAFIRDAAFTFPPARVEFLRDILIKMGHVVGTPTGVDPGNRPQYANALSNNYPNPFNPTTTIAYSIKETGHVSLKVYNAAGQLVRTLVDEKQSPRPEGFRIEWDGKSEAGTGVASGVYFYRMTAKNFELTKKMVMLK